MASVRHADATVDQMTVVQLIKVGIGRNSLARRPITSLSFLALRRQTRLNQADVWPRSWFMQVPPCGDQLILDACFRIDAGGLV